MTADLIQDAYKEVKRLCRVDLKSENAGSAILQLALRSLTFLVNECKQIDLVSRVPGKEYFSFSKDNVVARPANKKFFLIRPDMVSRLWKRWQAETITPVEFGQLTYTVALAPCLAMEIFDRQNKKGPATFFECYVGHLFARAVDVNPTKRARLPVHGQHVLMTMDFLMDIGGKKVHLPVKMSSRERVVQAWVHQRLLNEAYGSNAYQGILILFSETKLDSRSLEVVEICVPDQWLVYQSFLARMNCIYYFDVPVRYQELTQQFPDLISIKQFGDFFSEKEKILQP
ncbi:hypothetical protein [Chloracidobacterium thermophilum]|uniref:hypothetical protein n=1 Tax=Chloracidobacterium thermophilum TaxID=458033 RepID=UPI0007388F81|nr:hypothetical protein [Chloracidobacterium thermophilum]